MVLPVLNRLSWYFPGNLYCMPQANTRRRVLLEYYSLVLLVDMVLFTRAIIKSSVLVFPGTCTSTYIVCHKQILGAE